MAVYATREDVLRELGGDRPSLEERFSTRKWNEATESVTVDGLTFDFPTSLLVRIDVRLRNSSSRLDTAIFTAYEDVPSEPYPPHLVEATAKLSAFDSVNSDGTRPEYLREMKQDVDTYFLKIAAMELDLGIAGPRANHRAPAAFVARGVGQRGRSGRLGVSDGCAPFPEGPCDC